MPYRLSGFRLTMNEQRRNAKFGELLDWAETVLRTQYRTISPSRSGRSNHPEATWKLAGLDYSILPGLAAFRVEVIAE